MSVAIVFDLDGTLVDSLADLAGAVNRMLGDVGHAPLPQTTIGRFVGNGLPKLVERTIRHCEIDMNRHGELTKLTLDHYNKASSDQTVPYPGVMEALAELRRQGHRLGVCTNKPEEPARHVLKALNLAHHFDVVFGGDTLSVRKPNPKHLNETFDALGCSGPRLFVGDSEVDAETAKRAEVLFLLFTEGYRKSPVAEIPHTISYDDSAKLPALVGRFLAGTD